MYTKVVDFLSHKIGVAPECIQPEKTLEDLGADSLDIVEIFLDAEDEFKLDSISDAEASKVKTVQQFYDLVKEKSHGTTQG